jgi:hypothetical protein
MEVFIVLVIVFLLIRGLAKMGQGQEKRTRPTRSMPPPTPPPPPPSPPRPKPRPKPKPAASKFPREDEASHSDAYIRYLIDVLRVGQPAASQQAVNRLIEMGRQALPALREAERDPSAFVRERAQQAIEGITGELKLPGTPDAAPAAPPAPEPPPPPPPPLEEEPLRTPEPEREAPRVELPPAPPSVFDTPFGDATDVELPDLPDTDVEAEEEEPAPEPAPEPETEREEAEVPAAGPIGLDVLASTLQEAAEQPSFGGNREEILARLAGAAVRFTVRVERTQWTMGLGVPKAFEGGRTVAGHIAGTEVPVAVCLPASSNEVADALKDGEEIAFVGTYLDWDGLYDRGKFAGEIEGGA